MTYKVVHNTREEMKTKKTHEQRSSTTTLKNMKII